ncbi:MAG: hypothetical protein O2807_07975 [bacterium]|nr:hypothetical protein [bacterium]
MSKTARTVIGAFLLPYLAAGALSGCAARVEPAVYTSRMHAFQVRTIREEPWRRTPDVADILALNDPSTSVLYYDNPHSGGVISFQIVSRRFDKEKDFILELKDAYRRMLSAPHTDMRTVLDDKFRPFEKAVSIGVKNGIHRGEFYLRGRMGRRPSAASRERARNLLEEGQPFGGPREEKEVKEARKFRYESLTPAYTANYRGKMVVFMRGNTLFEFAYIDHTLAFGKGLATFDEFVKSMEFLPRGLFSILISRALK